MEAMEVIKLRRSIRQYKDKPIPRDLLEKILDAGRFAPTARNIQPWEFVVVTKKETLSKLAKIAENGRFIAQAAACIAVFSADTKYYLEDGCAATLNILLAATSLGIGSCWIAGDKKPYCPEVSSLFGAPESFKLISLIALGYPLSEDAFKVAADKKKLNELIHWEKL